MTEPKTGPGTGSTSASAGAPAVPPQLGQQQGRGVPAGQQAEYVEYSEHAEYASQPGYGGDSVLAAAAGMSWEPCWLAHSPWWDLASCCWSGRMPRYSW